MATGRVFRSCRTILILLLLLSSVLGNRPCSKHSCRGNKTLCSQLNAADAKDGLDIFGVPLQDVINAFEFGGHIGFDDEGSQSSHSKRKYHRSIICLYGDISSCVTYQLMKESSVKRILQSGDVHTHPGPVRNPCSVCTRPVAKTHRAVECDSCQKWCHIGKKCGNIPAEDYQVMISSATFLWRCPPCLNRLPSQQQVEQLRPRSSHQETITSNLQSGDTNIEAYDDLKENIKGPGISAGHTNIRSIVKNLNEIKPLLQHTNFGLLALTETHLTDQIDDSEVYIDGYEIIRMDCKNRPGGGCAIYYKNFLDVVVIAKYDTTELEALWVELKLCSQRLLIGTIYRPPDQSNFYEKLPPVLENIWSTRKNILITGDFNSDLSPEHNNGNGKKLSNILKHFDLVNAIKRPTRVTMTTKTTLDLVIVSDITKVKVSGVLDASIADHKLVYASLNLKKKRPPPQLVTVRNYKNLDINAFKRDIQMLPGGSVQRFRKQMMSPRHGQKCMRA